MVQMASKYMKNSKKQKAPKQAIKDASKKAKKLKVPISPLALARTLLTHTQ